MYRFRSPEQTAQDWAYEQQLFRNPAQDFGQDDPGIKALEEHIRRRELISSHGLNNGTTYSKPVFEPLKIDIYNPFHRGIYLAAMIGVFLYMAPDIIVTWALDRSEDDIPAFFRASNFTWIMSCLWVFAALAYWFSAREVALQDKRPVVLGEVADIEAGVTPILANSGRWHGPGWYDDQGNYFGDGAYRPYRGSGEYFWETTTGGYFAGDGRMVTRKRDWYPPNVFTPWGWWKFFQDGLAWKACEYRMHAPSAWSYLRPYPAGREYHG